MLEGPKRAMIERAMRQMTPSETEVTQGLAEIIAGLEHEQAQAVARLADAANLGVDVGHDIEERRDQLLRTADAVADDSLGEQYLEEVGIEPADTLPYLGMSEDEYQQQREEWYEMYQTRGIVEQSVEDASPETIDHIVNRHIEQALHDNPAEWIAHVVGWSKPAAMQVLLAGPIEQHTELIERAAEEIESDES